jgi:Potential Queuosine, Q, salvage protein family
VRELWRGYSPPDFAHVPDPDAAIFLCAVDHKTGYERPHVVDGAGPFAGSELMWTVALRRAEILNAEGLRDVASDVVMELFAIDDETVADPERRAALWRDLARGLERDYDGSAQRLLDSAGGRLARLLDRLAAFDAYSDPLAKKSQLFAKVCERRGWFEVTDPEHWQVSADNVLMRLALRSGLVEPGDLDRVRAATSEAFKRLALEAEIPPPELDDMLWELGRDDPDLLGVVADLREPPRDPSSSWY